MAGFKSGFIALVGRPNVGKSTLINSLVGQKVVITSDKPQTTRNRINAILTREDAQLIFVDTPGIHKPLDRMGNYLVDAAYQALEEVDLILFLVEATSLPGAGDKFVARKLEEVKTPSLLVLNKIDLVDKKQLPARIEAYQRLNCGELVPISAAQGTNLDALVEMIAGKLPEGPQYYPGDMVVDRMEQFVITELIREKILHLTREEVPHSVAVEIEEYKERDKQDKIYIRATIFVERDSQKGILIGKGGKMLKKIGLRARVDIERLLGTKIYLDLWVKVKKDWREKEEIFKKFGYKG
ncbi:MAG: GTPase Era [Halanaerobium sp.]|nr:GTPase Era [Halanaerobium sp.]